jgi:hypothetical protein
MNQVRGSRIEVGKASAGYSPDVGVRHFPPPRITEEIKERLSPEAEALLIRHPSVDHPSPSVPDVDVLGIRRDKGLLPERLFLGKGPAKVPIDVIWLSRDLVDNPFQFARAGLLPHRLLSSEILYDRDGWMAERWHAIESEMYRPEVWHERIDGFLQLAADTVREIGITWDFPPLALFWLHIALTACVTAACDGSGRYCPNIYTQPMAYLRDAAREVGVDLETPFVATLRLDREPRRLVVLLRSLHATIAHRFPEPVWPPAIRQDTRYEYRYFLSKQELDLRVAAAEQMIGRGEGPAAVFYLRFWAYALARIPMVHQRTLEGIDVSFLRPEKAVLPDLEKNCQEIVDELGDLLAGPEPIHVTDIQRGLQELTAFREVISAYLSERGIPTQSTAWQPFKPPP